MSDLPLQERSPLAGVLRPGRHGRSTGEPGVTVAERRGISLAMLAARQGAELTLRKAIRQSFGVELPAGPKRVAGGDLAFIGIGPAQWLVTSEAPAAGGGLPARLKHAAAGAASIVDQSQARAVLRLSGPRVRDALAKGCSIDLHPRAFAPGDAASTLVSHLTVLIAQIDAAPTYDLFVAGSYAGSLWAWLAASAAEFGYVAEG